MLNAVFISSSIRFLNRAKTFHISFCIKMSIKSSILTTNNQTRPIYLSPTIIFPLRNLIAICIYVCDYCTKFFFSSIC